VLASFVFGLFLLNYLIWSHRAIWHAYDPHPYRERLDVCGRQAWDLVVVGGSPAMYAIDPDVLAGTSWRNRPLKKVCNVALPLATTAEVYHMAEHNIRHRPRLLVYGLCATEFNEDRVEPLGPMFLMDGRDVIRWARQRPKAATWCVNKFVSERIAQLWSIGYYQRAMQHWAAYQLEEWWPGLCSAAAAEAFTELSLTVSMYGHNGYTPQPATPETRLDLLKARGRPLQGFSFMENYAVSGYLTYLHGLLDWAERRGVPVILVELPTSADLEERFPQAFAAFRARLREVERERHVRVLRPTRVGLGLEERHYADVIHLNADGAARLSAWLRRELARP
jgi:hypothetical protein